MRGRDERMIELDHGLRLCWLIASRFRGEADFRGNTDYRSLRGYSGLLQSFRKIGFAPVVQH